MYRFYKSRFLGIAMLIALPSVFLVVPRSYAEPSSHSHRVEKLVAMCVNAIETLSHDQRLIQALEQHKPLSLVTILKNDRQWRLSPPASAPVFPDSTVNAFLENTFITHKSIAEIIITDNMGATLFSKPLSTDFWQGDEAKFIEPATTGQTFVDQLTFDDSSKTFSVQISTPILSSHGEFLGVFIAGVEMPLDIVMDLPVGTAQAPQDTVVIAIK